MARHPIIREDGRAWRNGPNAASAEKGVPDQKIPADRGLAEERRSTRVRWVVDGELPEVASPREHAEVQGGDTVGGWMVLLVVWSGEDVGSGGELKGGGVERGRPEDVGNHGTVC